MTDLERLAMQAESIAEDALAAIDLFQRLWENTGNPLYVWQTIDQCFLIGLVQSRARAGQAQQTGPWPPHPFPPFVLAYLRNTASRIECLTRRIDYRLAPQPCGDQEPTRESAQQFLDAEPTLSAKEAGELVTRATGFVREKWNAFDRYTSDKEKDLDQFSYEALRFEGNPHSQAIDIVLQETGLADERALRKRFAAARNARKAAPPSG